MAKNKLLKNGGHKYYFQYDKKGNKLAYYHNNDKGLLNSGIGYEYDTSNNLVFSYFFDNDSIYKVEEFIYTGGRIIEKRQFQPTNLKININNRYSIRENAYLSTEYHTDSNKKGITYTLYCKVNYPPYKDSITERFDSVNNSFILAAVPRKKITQSKRDCTCFYENLYDSSGNLIREKTLSGTDIYVYDSFCYDHRNNLIFSINFNSGHIHKGDGRSYKKGINQTERIVNLYNATGNLEEKRQYFNNDSLTYLATRFLYDESGHLTQKVILKYYSKGVKSCLLTNGEDINGLRTKLINPIPFQKDSMLYDSVEYYKYSKSGQLEEQKVYYSMPEADEGGTLYYSLQATYNTVMAPSYKQICYYQKKSRQYNDVYLVMKYEYIYSHFKNGLIKEIKAIHNGMVYRIKYEFY